MTKKLKNNIQALAFLGSVTITGGTYLAIIILNTKNPLDWGSYNIFFTFLGAIISYYYISYKNPGGRVTLNFDKTKYNTNEKILYNLIVKYKSNKLIIFPLILFFISYTILNQIHKSSYVGSFESFFGSFMIGGFIIITVCGGMKYLSTWWNIKKVLKQDPSGKKLLDSVPHDRLL